MAHVIDNLDSWLTVSMEEIISKADPIENSLTDIIVSYCKDMQDDLVKLYIPDKGFLVNVVTDRADNPEDVNIQIRGFVPNGNPSTDPDNYFEVKSEYQLGSILPLLLILTQEDFRNIPISREVKELIAGNYYKSNKYSLFNSILYNDKFILYLDVDRDKRDYKHVDNSMSYDDIVRITSYDILISEEEQGIYYLDESGENLY